MGSERDPVSPVTAKVVRDYLSAVSAGTAPSTDSVLFEDLRRRGALSGTADHPALTAVGQHVLNELKIRAYRLDAMGLDAVSEELGATLSDLDGVARVVTYFLSELGPIIPPEAVPYTRISAAGLANRRTDPEELAELFRNVWGMVEVMESDGRDRLLAAELLARSPVPVSRMYAPIMHTMEMLIQGSPAPRTPAGTAAILHLFPSPTPEAKIAEYRRWRGSVGSDEAAALLAGAVPFEQASRLEKITAALSGGKAALGDAAHAAACLLILHPEPETAATRTAELGARFQGRLPTPLTAAALLVTRHTLSTDEMADWVEKAVGIASTRRLAPTPPELFAMGIGLVHGVAPDRFQGVPVVATAVPESGSAILGLVALHAWIYRAALNAK